MRRSARLITILLAIDLTDIARYGEGLDLFTTVPEPRQHGTPLTSRYCDSQSRSLTWRDCGMLFKRTNDYFRSAFKLPVHVGEAAAVTPEIGNFGNTMSRFLSCGAAAVRNFVSASRSGPCRCRTEHSSFPCARFLPSPLPRSHHWRASAAPLLHGRYGMIHL